MSTPLGVNSKLYYNSATYGTPTWVEVSLIADLAVNPQWDERDVSSRGSRVKSMKKTMLGIEVTGTLKKKPGDTVYGKFVDALMSDDTLDVLVLDGPRDQNNVRGYRFDAQVHQGNDDQSLAGGGFLDIVLKPLQDTNPAKAVLVTGGAPTYATPGADGDTYA